MTAPDHIIVGSGINALVCAALLGKKGGKVLVLERNDRIGGCIRTEEITAPGFVHDVMATTFVLFITSPAYAALAADLGRHGLEFCHTRSPTGVLRPDGSHLDPAHGPARPTLPPSTATARNMPPMSATSRRTPACCSACSAAGSGHIRRSSCSPARLGAGHRAGSPPSSAMRSSRRAAGLKPHTNPTCPARSGRPGCCMPGSAPRTPSPARSPRSSPLRWRLPARRSSRAARRTCSPPSRR